ncbi:mRNA interferase RelE/StbE [Methylomarinovum caldicuralii]|uniref:mRNA interferase RelE/StbE n=1 Tax=Methylomarinovum caldicuralii TaxID=438856 RepID=A0AAU9C6S7_9GAMM|nr:type II toxin-antitoxin system RelE/ParE family toxin [Methylomarinovum caldicuralii]BCX82899.1 mRNA interferase RelE/StbE [Methylomarinovum caldicuralii]
MEVIWTPKALKQLVKLKDQQTRVRIVQAARNLSAFPNVPGIKALKNHHYGYRLRVGDYRVLFDVLDHAHIVSIEEVKKRDARTY